MSDRPASWRMPSPKQMEKLAERRCPKPVERTNEDAWWDAVLADARGTRSSGSIPIQRRRLSEISCQSLRVECIRCFRTVEISVADAMRIHGPGVIWNDVGRKLLDDGCRHRTGRHEEDGCWPRWKPMQELRNR